MSNNGDNIGASFIKVHIKSRKKGKASRWRDQQFRMRDTTDAHRRAVSDLVATT